MENYINFRPATADDGEFIAKCVEASINPYYYDFDKAPSQILIDASIRDNTLYSYRNAMIAECGDELVGGTVAYPGEDYPKLVQNTFPGYNLLPEANCGEYYLNVVTLIPKFRGRNLGRLLINAEIEKGLGLNYTKFSLLVDQGNTGLQTYYENLGFRVTETVTIFGLTYNRCVRVLEK